MALEPDSTKLKQWRRYAALFLIEAEDSRLPKVLVDACLGYAKKLLLQGLPVIFDSYDLARQTGYLVEYITGAVAKPERYYRRFVIAKRSGGERQISEPLPTLKKIQKWILSEILEVIPIAPPATAYRKKVSTKSNARFHTERELVLKLDIKDFFPSITQKRVNGLFRALGYSKQIAFVLARLSTLKNELPQGAPTSATLSNILCRHLDARLLGFARKHELHYTRYADDLTFSGKFDPAKIIAFCSKVMRENQFKLNTKKTRVARRGSRQIVTGLIVNNKKIRVPREYRRRLRQVAYLISKFGLEDYILHSKETRSGVVEHLSGMANYVLSVDPKDRDALKTLEILHANQG